jgi:hypothetical protein
MIASLDRYEIVVLLRASVARVNEFANLRSAVRRRTASILTPRKAAVGGAVRLRPDISPASPAGGSDG